MDLKETQATILRFRNYVIQQSRSNLTKSRKNVTKQLYNSIKGEIVTEGDYTIVAFEMDEHGMYQDKGVKGAKSSSKAPNSPFRFKSKMPPVAPIAKWAKFRGIRLRDDKGKFVKGSYKTIGFLIARSIFRTGMKPSLFFTKPFEAGYKKYIDTDLIKAFGQDVDTLVGYNLKDIK